MNIVQLTPGAAGMYCGGCMRDNALVAALRKLGHDALLLPLYTPLTTDEPDNSIDRIFFGGLNVYLQQKVSVFRKTPAWLDSALDHPALLRMATRFAVKTAPEELGALTLSMLKGEAGQQAKELDKLVDFLTHHTKPAVICLSNVLLAGMACRLRAALKVPIVCTLQGEDFFLDGLPSPYKEDAWAVLQQQVAHIDGFIAVSQYYGEVMSRRLSLAPKKLHVVHNGINIAGYAPAAQPPAQPTVGFLARMAPEKGLKTLLDAFTLLHQKNNAIRLRIAGSVTGGDKPYVDKLRDEISRVGLSQAVDFLPNLDRNQKVSFLQSLSVLSVPATYGEAFGLYVLEALACGVPVVQPRHGAFPELLERTGGGILCKPDDPADLAAQLGALLNDAPRRAQLGTEGRTRVLADFQMERVARDVCKVFETVQPN